MARLLPSLLLSLLLFTVLWPAAAVAAGEAPPEVRFLLSNSAPFVGEEVVLTLEVRYRQRPGGRMAVRWPRLDGCVVADLPPLPPRREEGADGALLVESARRLLRPLAAGRLSLAGGIELHQTFLPAPPLALRVRSLPAGGRPAAFTGAVGAVALELRADGSGTREVGVTLRGNAPLDAFPLPEPRLGRKERLIALGETLSGEAGEVRQRRFRYLYLPGEGRRGRLAFTLAVFDPASQRYQLLEAELLREMRGRWDAAPVIAALGAVLVTLLLMLRRRRRPSSLAHLVARALGRPVRGLSRAQLLAGLREYGIPAAIIEDLVGVWEAEDRRRFAPRTLSAAPEDLFAMRRRVAIRLANHIDKYRRIP